MQKRWNSDCLQKNSTPLPQLLINSALHRKANSRNWKKSRLYLALLFYFSGSLNSTEEREEELTAHLSGMEGAVLQLLSARTGKGVQELQNKLLQLVNTGELRNNNTIVTNSRHYNAFLSVLEEINRVEKV